MSAYVRAYHSREGGVRVFDDSIARRLFTDGEYADISRAVSGGAAFFGIGDASEAERLRAAVNGHLAPAVLARSAFAEDALKRAAFFGAGQYLLLGAGYDSFVFRRPEWAGRLSVFELDSAGVSADRALRAARAGLASGPNCHSAAADLSIPGWSAGLSENPAFSPGRITFCSMLGLIYYLSPEAVAGLFAELGELLRPGSSVVFDCPSDVGFSREQSALAAAAGESMQPGYSYSRLERLLSESGFLIYEHLRPEEITRRFFTAYNRAQPLHPMSAPGGVSLYLAVRSPV